MDLYRHAIIIFYCNARSFPLRWLEMPTTPTPGPMKVTPLGNSLSPLCEFSQSLKSTMYQFEVGDGYCGQAIGRPEKVGFSFTAVMTEADAQRLKLCWDSHDAIVEALQWLMGQVNNIEVLGEYSALDINPGSQRRMRAALDATLEKCRSALAIADPQPQPDTEESDHEQATRERKGGAR